MSRLYGTGTDFIGGAHPRADGSKIVTHWFTIAYLPVLPLGSSRIQMATDAHYPGGVAPKFYYWRTLERVGLYWPHVAWGYSLTLGFFLIATMLDPHTRWIELAHPRAATALAIILCAWLLFAGVSRLRENRAEAHTKVTPPQDA